LSRQENSVLGVIGGSGLYDLAGIENLRAARVSTPFGEPSDEIVLGRLGSVDVAFLPRHGRGHTIGPTEINFRANVYALKQLGVEFLISVGAVGSLREELRPGSVVVPDQFIDRTVARPSTFFGGGVVAHVSLAEPVCPVLAEIVAAAAVDCGGAVRRGGTYICMEGPQFSTRAESHLYRSWGADVIGMTNWQEAKLAREAEICFASLAMVTDYDCWKEDEAAVAVEDILRILRDNAELARRSVAAAAGALPAERACRCATALDGAIITAPEEISAAARARLEWIIGKYVKENR
jgi:5'-methylthioadenosine phosphorylase